jgi:hypothetical protein
MNHIYKNSPRRQEAINKFSLALTDTHIYLDGEWQSKSDVFDRHYKEPRPGEMWSNPELELIMGKELPIYSYLPRPMEWKDKRGVTHIIDPKVSGEEAEAESTKELIRQKCMAELRGHDIMANEKNDITLSYDKLLEMMVNVSGRLLNNAFKIWGEI